MTLLFACGMGQRGSAPPPELRVEALSAGTQGGGSRPDASAEWVSSLQDLELLFETLNAGQLPAQDLTKALEVDFSTSRVLLVRMGQKPTAGYGLRLDRESCGISRKIAVVSLIWTEPDPGMVAAQVITSPFVVLAISKDGYDRVEIVDQHGKIQFDLPVDE